LSTLPPFAPTFTQAPVPPEPAPEAVQTTVGASGFFESFDMEPPARTNPARGTSAWLDHPAVTHLLGVEPGSNHAVVLGLADDKTAKAARLIQNAVRKTTDAQGRNVRAIMRTVAHPHTGQKVLAAWRSKDTSAHVKQKRTSRKAKAETQTTV
jgi:hypothetical protein